MQNLIKFILKYSNFLVFLFLEVVAFLLIVNNNEYPHSSTLSTANKMVAWHYQMVNNITGYFSLKHVNEELSAENAMLRDELTRLANLQEDSLENMYPYAHLRQHYIPAKVVHLTTSAQHNTLTINKGKKDGIYEGAGVINSEGVVGIVRAVSEDFSVVIPIIHTNAGLSCRFQKNDYIGTLKWNGVNSRYAQLIDIASHIDVNEGDTILTSGLSPTFPEGIPVGIVDNCTLGSGDSYYTIRVRLQTDFRRLKYVHIIANATAQQQNNILNGLD